ncbi:hypothetical protein C8Q73DRAFT_36971 [Cubamyces lactineus]|nr:hypothetical protein C8Q73DRAFT_12506 [Cubamyces lactineus]KAH9903142.1 hypothetical protein C8Q73DRAFT_36971 [Cubamyces lactineus]
MTDDLANAGTLLINEQKAHVHASLRVLQHLIDAIPPTVPEGTVDGPLAVSSILAVMRTTPSLGGRYGSFSPVLSRIARDVLAILGVSIAVERLAISASRTIITNEWLRRGFGDNVE